MFPDQVDLWLKYHDDVTNDNTARTNQYQMPLGVFVIIDSRCKIRIFGYSSVLKEQPNKPIYRCRYAEIPIIFPETYPTYCIFHIAQNLSKI